MKWLFDFNKYVTQSYIFNFINTVNYICPAHLFIYKDEDELCVNILHASPPCQLYSPVYTVALSKRDEVNQVALLTIF